MYRGKSMKRVNTKKTKLALIIPMLISGFNTQVLANETKKVELEVIEVTTQKRIQNIQDVPVSVSAVNGDWMEKNNIDELEDMASLMPSLSFSGSPNVNTVRIRGLGTGGGNPAFEQSVGMYVDGIYAGRGYQFSLPYLDVERIEVLKGPQGVLLGKNSIAGALSITSARPSEHFEAKLGVSYEAENGGHSLETMVNGELADGLYGRFAASKVKENGWVENTFLDKKDQPEQDMDGYRMSLLWEASDDIEVYFKYDHGTHEETGSPMGIKHVAPGTPWEFLYKSIDPDFGLITDHLQSSGRSLTKALGGPSDGYFKNVESDAVTLQVDWSLGESTLTSITGYSSYDASTFSDSSFSPLTLINQRSTENFDQFTQELRLTSPTGGEFEYIVGLFYLDRAVELPASYQDLEFTSLFGPTLPAPFPPLPTSLAAASLKKQFDEDTTSLSVFGQLTWNISDTFRANLGLRYTDEEKDAVAQHDLLNLGGSDALNPVGKQIYAQLFKAVDYSYSGTISEQNLDPSLNFQWDVNNDVMMYVSATKATKAGGFNANDLSGNENTIQFEEEEAVGFEAGIKAQLLNNRLRLNSALFRTEFDNLQVSLLDGDTSTFYIGNAASATTQGLELDGTYLLTDNIIIGGSATYLDSQFDEFPGAPCATSIYLQSDCIVTPAGASRNAKGDSLIHSPDWSANFYIDYSSEFTDSMLLNVNISGNYVGEHYLNLTYAEPLTQSAYTKWNARISIADIDDKWEVALVGKNLFDKTTSSFGDNVFQNPGAYFSNVDAPRQVFLNATLRFY